MRAAAKKQDRKEERGIRRGVERTHTFGVHEKARLMTSRVLSGEIEEWRLLFLKWEAQRGGVSSDSPLSHVSSENTRHAPLPLATAGFPRHSSLVDALGWFDFLALFVWARTFVNGGNSSPLSKERRTSCSTFGAFSLISSPPF